MSSLCVCGHASDWHSYGGHGDCEHDPDCKCAAFVAHQPWVEHGREASLLLSCVWHAGLLADLSDAWKARVERALDSREELIAE